jgi:hypothetical protein
LGAEIFAVFDFLNRNRTFFALLLFAVTISASRIASPRRQLLAMRKTKATCRDKRGVCFAHPKKHRNVFISPACPSLQLGQITV